MKLPPGVPQPPAGTKKSQVIQVLFDRAVELQVEVFELTDGLNDAVEELEEAVAALHKEQAERSNLARDHQALLAQRDGLMVTLDQLRRERSAEVDALHKRLDDIAELAGEILVF